MSLGIDSLGMSSFGLLPDDVTVSDAFSTAAADAISLLQPHTVSVGTLVSSGAVATVSLTQTYILQIADLANSCILSTISLSQQHLAGHDQCVSGAFIESISIIQTVPHAIGMSDAISSAHGGSVAVEQIQSLSIAATVGNATADAVQLIPVIVLYAADVVGLGELSSVSIRSGEIGVIKSPSVINTSRSRSMRNATVTRSMHLTRRAA